MRPEAGCATQRATVVRCTPSLRLRTRARPSPRPELVAPWPVSRSWGSRRAGSLGDVSLPGRRRARVGAMTALPSGTVTLLFTDVEGSTRLLEELGRGYEAALVEHHRIVREALDRHGGCEVDTQGRRSSLPSGVRATRSRPPWTSSERSGRIRFAFGSASTPASRALPRRATSVSTFRGPRASAPPATGGKCCFRRPRGS